MTTTAPAVPKTEEKLTWTKKKCTRTHLGEGGSAIPVRALVPALRQNVYFSNNMGFNKYLFDSNWYFFDNFPTHKFLSHPLKSIFLIRLIPKAAMYIFLCSGVFVRHIFSFLDEFSVPTGSNYFENILKIFSSSLPTCSSLPLFPSPPPPSSRCSRYCLWDNLFEEWQTWKWDE